MARDRGFTLVEVLVALAILAVALTAAFRASGVATDTARDFRERLLAGWVAENRLAEYRSGRLPNLGEQSGVAEQAGTAFAWRERIAATSTPLLRRIEVRVSLVTDPEHTLTALVGYALGRP